MSRVLVAVLATLSVVLAACGAQAPSPSAAPSSPASPSASPQPSVGETPSEAPSSPGVSWEPATVPSSNNASGAITILPGGDGLVAIGFDGGFGSILWTSGDGGRSWTDITPADFASIGLASAIEYDGMLVGVGRGNTIDIEAEEAAVYLSDDGVEWRKVETATQLIGQMIDLVATDDGLFAVGGVPGADSAGIWRSTDAETWELVTEMEHAFLWSIAEGGPGLVAVGWRRTPDPSAAAWTSTDGIEWTLGPDPEGFDGYEATDVIDLDGTLAMVGSSFATQGGRMWFSEDGLDWRVAADLDSAYARTVTRAPVGLIAVGGGEEMAGAAWLSTDGRTWEPLGERLPGAYFNAAHVTDDGLLVAGATQSGTVETGIQAYAQIWSATLSD